MCKLISEFHEQTLLEEAVENNEMTNADITVFQYRLFYGDLNLTSKRLLGLSLRNSPDNLVLQHEKSYDEIFSFTTPHP